VLGSIAAQAQAGCPRSFGSFKRLIEALREGWKNKKE